MGRGCSCLFVIVGLFVVFVLAVALYMDWQPPPEQVAEVVAEAPASTGPSDLLFILDGSGSMWGQIEGENKIVIARRALTGLLGVLPSWKKVGLVAYGHRREGDCDDVETLVPLDRLDRAAMVARLEALRPRGKTPITRALEASFNQLEAADAAATLVLISDGLETCGGDPCAAVRAAREREIDFRLHVIGFDLGGEGATQLECAAEIGGGLYLTADDATQLNTVLGRVVEAPLPKVPQS